MSVDPRTFNGYVAFDKTGECKLWQFKPRPLGDEDVEIKWPPYPCVAGHEIVGEVVVVGPGVKNLAVGDRVGVGAEAWACLNRDPNNHCRDCADGEDAVCDQGVFTINAAYKDGSRQQGGFADFIRVDSNYAFKIPDMLPSDALRTLKMFADREAAADLNKPSALECLQCNIALPAGAITCWKCAGVPAAAAS
ncbi:hypothetical protein ON010_g7103 [Phytophthora cinnamomi]|nr:hypothetical protein ON010_g7103 [Phytophthora cinnamomi]